MKETWNVLDPDEYVKHNPFMGYTNMKTKMLHITLLIMNTISNVITFMAILTMLNVLRFSVRPQ